MMRSTLVFFLILLASSQAYSVPVSLVGQERDLLGRALALENLARRQARSTDEQDRAAVMLTIERSREIYREIIKFTSGPIAQRTPNPYNLEARRRLAFTHVAMQRPEDTRKAIIETIQALTSNPRFASGWILLGDINSTLLTARRHLTSTEEADRLIEFSLTQFLSVPQLATSGQRGLATQSLVLIRRQPNDPDLNGLLILLLETFYKTANEHDRESGSLLSLAGFYHRLTLESVAFEEAILNTSGRLLEAAPFDPAANMLMARAHHRLAERIGDADDAEQQSRRVEHLKQASRLYQRVSLLAPRLPNALEGYLDVLVKLEGVDAALQALQQMLEREVNTDAAIRYRKIIAELHAGADMIEGAVSHWQALIDDYPERIDLYEPLLALYQRHEMDDEAVKLLEGAVAKIPSFVNARVTLGNLYLRAGRHREAEEQFGEALRLRDSSSFKLIIPQGQTAEAALMLQLHNALMGLSSIYVGRNELSKAGDIFHFNMPVYFRSSPAGGLLLMRDGIPVPHGSHRVAAEGMFQAGISYARGRERARAIEKLELAIKLRGGSFFEAQRELAAIHLSVMQLNAAPEEKMEAAAKARQIWQDILRERPDDPAAKLNLATITFSHFIYHSMRLNATVMPQSAAEALALVNDVLEKDQGNLNARLIRATINDFFGRMDEVRHDFDAVMQIKLDDARTLTDLEVRPATEAELASIQQSLGSMVALIFIEQGDLAAAEAMIDDLTPKGNSASLADASAWLLYHRAKQQSDAATRSEMLRTAITRSRRAMGAGGMFARRIAYRHAVLLLEQEQGFATMRDAYRLLNSVLEYPPSLREGQHARELLRSLDL